MRSSNAGSASWPRSPMRRERTAVALAMADAFARKDQVAEEFATYDRLLAGARGAGRSRAARRRHVAGRGRRTSRRGAGGRALAGLRAGARSLHRPSRRAPSSSPPRWRSIDGRSNAIRATRACTRRPRSSSIRTASRPKSNRSTAWRSSSSRIARWHHRLARWYFRQRPVGRVRTADARRHPHLRRHRPGALLPSGGRSRARPSTRRLYLQLNLYAHDRFPHHLVFVRNLLSAYRATATLDPAAREALLRRHWVEDEALAVGVLCDALAHRTGSMPRSPAMRSVSAAAGEANWARLAKDHPLAARFLAEADIWRSRFEAATPVLDRAGDRVPGRRRAESASRLAAPLVVVADARETDAAAADAGSPPPLRPRSQADADDARRDLRRSRTLRPRARVLGSPAGHRAGQRRPGISRRPRSSGTTTSSTTRCGSSRWAERGCGEPALYAYEAGAIHEGLRQPERAIDEYVRGALAAPGDSPARSRLLTLARRPAYRALADRASAAAVDGDAPSAAAVSLRIAVLEAQGRRDDLERFLADAARSHLLARADGRGRHACRRLGFDAVRTRALARQIELMRDPIDKLQLRYALVRLYESRGELDAARTDAGRGVRREPADPRRRPADRRLLLAAQAGPRGHRRPDARRVAVVSGAEEAVHVRGARQVDADRRLRRRRESCSRRSLPTIRSMPTTSRPLPTATRSPKTMRSLRDFYTTSTHRARCAAAPISAEERTRRIAGLRRGLIPALARLNDHAGAVDQYIEIINRYPDDEALLQEAGRYARQHARTNQLLAYYTKTAADSPRDYRWPMLLAKLADAVRGFPGGHRRLCEGGRHPPGSRRLPDRARRPRRAVDAVRRCGRQLHENLRADLSRPAMDGEDCRASGAPGTGRRCGEGAADRARRGAPGAGRDFLRRRRAARAVADARGGEVVRRRGRAARRARGLLESGSTYVSVYTRLRQSTAVFDRLLAARTRGGGGPRADARRVVDGERAVGAARTRWASSSPADSRRRRRWPSRRFSSRRGPRCRSGDFAAVPRAARRARRPARARRALAHRADGRAAAQNRVERASRAARAISRPAGCAFAELASELERFADSRRTSGVRRPRRARPTRTERRAIRRASCGCWRRSR